MDKGVKNKVGRPPMNKPLSDASKAYTVSLTPNKRDAIVKKYGSLTEALNYLEKQIKK